MKVKLFDGFMERQEENGQLEQRINEWLAKTNAEIVDIKFSSTYVPKEQTGGANKSLFYILIMVIYKEVEEKPNLAGLFSPGSGATPEQP